MGLPKTKKAKKDAERIILLRIS
eukprot:SAG31_NODE_19769_length_592_cov_0.807302_1_plen_22_part_10